MLARISQVALMVDQSRQKICCISLLDQVDPKQVVLVQHLPVLLRHEGHLQWIWLTKGVAMLTFVWLHIVCCG